MNRLTAAAAATLLLCAQTAQAAPDLSSALGELRAGRAPEAAQIMLGLASAGSGEAQFNLALLYTKGLGVPQNDREALYWAWRARLSGLSQAQAMLQSLADKATPDLSRKLAARLNADLDARIAAADGRAMLERSIVFAEVLPQPDLRNAYVWQALSAALGTPNAATLRDATLASLPPENRLAAQDAALKALGELCAAEMASHPLCATLQ